jgi:hypothetical protein
LFAWAGYELEWIRDRTRPRPEFKAKHRSSGSEVLVEAKSRHREGVLGFPGEAPGPDELEIDVRHLMEKALKKETDGLAYAIAIDLNMPTDEHTDIQPLIDEVHEKVLVPFGNETTGKPDPFSAVLITNYSWHWSGEELPDTPAILVIRGEEAAVPLPLKEFQLIFEAAAQYGQVPA